MPRDDVRALRYVMGGGYSEPPQLSYGGGNNITQLLLEQGRAQAEAARNQGQIWQNAIQQGTQQLAAGFEKAAEEKKSAKRDSTWLAMMKDPESWKDPATMMARANSVWGPDKGPEMFKAAVAAHQLSQPKRDPAADAKALPAFGKGYLMMDPEHQAKAWPEARAMVMGAHPNLGLPEQYDPAYVAGTLKPLIDAAGEGGEYSLEKTAGGLAPFDKKSGKLGAPVAQPEPQAPKLESRTIDEQLAAAQLAGDRATYTKLLEVKRQSAAAGRDPAAMAAAAASREAAGQSRLDARLDKSYQFNSTQLEQARKPLVDQAERFGRLVETVNQRTPQADALIAPELLTVMAGGSGSGLRMNEAEISRVLGGRTNLEGLKAKLNKWQLDPSAGLSITDAQREQIRALISKMHERITTKIGAFNDASEALVNAPDVETHRRILAGLKSKLSSVGEAEPELEGPVGGTAAAMAGALKNPFDPDGALRKRRQGRP